MKDDIDKEIADAESKLASLKLRKVRLQQMTPEQKVAVKLHDLFCHSNHTDGCGWLYEVRDGIHDWRGDHESYLQKATKLVALIDEDVDVMYTLEALHKVMRQ